MPNIYAIKDKDIGFTEIISFPNNAIAVRKFYEICNNKDTDMNKYPESFEFFKLGELNSDTGEIKPVIEKIASATDTIVKDQANK